MHNIDAQRSFCFWEKFFEQYLTYWEFRISWKRCGPNLFWTKLPWVDLYSWSTIRLRPGQSTLEGRKVLNAVKRTPISTPAHFPGFTQGPVLGAVGHSVGGKLDSRTSVPSSASVTSAKTLVTSNGNVRPSGTTCKGRAGATVNCPHLLLFPLIKLEVGSGRAVVAGEDIGREKGRGIILKSKF
eukprot:jgi/Botrbrau1/2722/Bobra.0164s0002.1